MGGWVEWMGGWESRWVGGRAGGWVGEQVGVWVSRRVSGWVSEQVNERVSVSLAYIQHNDSCYLSACSYGKNFSRDSNFCTYEL